MPSASSVTESGAAATTVEAVDGVPRPVRRATATLDLVTGGGEPGDLRLADHVAPGDGDAGLDGTAGGRASASARAAAVAAPSRRAPAGPGGRPGSRSPSPATNLSERSTATSRSRLVTHPWIRARCERVGEAARGLLAGGRPGDHLREHRVVVRRHLVAGHEAGVEPDAGRSSGRTRRRLRGPRTVQRAALRLPVRRRVLGVQPDLDRVADGRRWCAGRGLALGDRQLQVDQVDAGGPAR